LENEKWGDGVLFEEFSEGGNWNIESIIAIMLLDSGEFGSSGYPSRLLEMFESWLGFGVDGVRKRFKGVLCGIVEESALLEQERNIIFAPSLICVSRVLTSQPDPTHSVPVYVANLRRPSISHR